ncbi:MAG: ADP-forming succinate--CoA ligase subunit beta [Thermoplasmatales archaeon]|nr:ADP-forming succinate--CoA ligase subunit beta [Thermoplasmatales archaeon]
MKLLEHQGKELFRSYGIPVPEGKVIERKEELKDIAILFPWVLKAQVLVGGRGKAGGIKVANDLREAEIIFDEMISKGVKGERVRKILVEEKIRIEKEYYLSFFIDRSSKQYLMMFCGEGGVDIESIAEKVRKVYINPFMGLQNYQLRKIPQEAREIAKNLFKLFVEKDCELAEINPLIISDGKAIAGDAKIIVDNNAIYRHPELPKEFVELSPLEKEAREKGIAFVQLEGCIGVIANGAGLTMATLDAINEFSGKGGVFLDLGGTDDVEKVKQAFELMAKANQKAILVNLFGGITKCDTVAKGIVEFMKEKKISQPVVARIKGINEEEARKMLKDYVITIDSFEEAAKKVVEVS